MIHYDIDIILPASFGDFIAWDHQKYPHVTLMTTDDAELHGAETSDGSNGWVDRILDVPAIDEGIARAALAEILGVSVDQIEIAVKGW